MFNRIIQFISFFFFGLALWLIIKEVEKAGWEKVWQLMTSTPLWVLLIACFFVIADFVVLACYDVLALDYIRYKLPFRTVFKTAAVGFAVSNTVGHAFISGGAVRYLFYTPLGSAMDMSDYGDGVNLCDCHAFNAVYARFNRSSAFKNILRRFNSHRLCFFGLLVLGHQVKTKRSHWRRYLKSPVKKINGIAIVNGLCR